MFRSKVDIGEADDETLLNEMYGVGQKTLNILSSAGYKLGKRATLKDFTTATGSWEQLRRQMQDSGIEAGYSETKLRQLWGHAQRRQKLRHQGPQEIKDPDANFLLAPEGPAPEGDPQLTTNEEETPEVHALSREPVPEKAVATGLVAPSVQMSVVPDVTLTVSPADKEIAAPTEAAEQDATPIVPAFDAGGGVAVGIQGVREVEPESLEEKQEGLAMDPEAPQTKANFMGDIGEDGKGAMLEQNDVNMRPAPAGSSSGAFRSVPYAGEGQAPSGGGQAPPPPQEQQPSPEDLVNGTQHPFRQQSLFRNHDDNMMKSRRLLEVHTDLFTNSLAARAASLVQQQDPSYTVYNPYTQGVQSVAMPVRRSMNYLSRAPLLPSFQYSGPQALMDIHNPSALGRDFLIGPFQ
jgi:hypothetical protein